MVANRATTRGQGRAALIATAVRLIAHHGIHGFALRTLADEARVSLGSVTYHFGTRENLIAEVICDHVTHCRDTISAAVLTAADAAPDDRNAVLRQALTDVYADRTRVLVSAEVAINAARDPDTGDAADDLDQLARDVFTAVHSNLGRAVTESSVRAAADSVTAHAVRTAQRHPADQAFGEAMCRYLCMSYSA